MTGFPRNLTAVLVFGRPLLVLGAFISAIWVMATQQPSAYVAGLAFLVLATLFDWCDGWFAQRYIPQSRLGPLANRAMDRIMLVIVFPMLVAGMFWRYHRMSEGDSGTNILADRELLHALFVLVITVVMLVRDQLVGFLRQYAPADRPTESFRLARAATLLASPLAVVLYAYAFYLPRQGWEALYRSLDWVNSLPENVLLVPEALFLILLLASTTVHMRHLGPVALEDICEDDERLRRRILAVMPNTLTLLNAVFGLLAVVLASQGRVREALFLLVGAAFFDRLDGSLARRLGLHEPIPDDPNPPKITTGAILDDISDMVSFAISPAIMFYLVAHLITGPATPGWVLWAALAYGAAGGARLIYFTLDKTPIPGFFKGMPVPAAALFTGSAIEIAFQANRYYPAYMELIVAALSGLMLLAALVMNLYFVRYIHFGRVMGRRPALGKILLVLWVGLVWTPFLGLVLMLILLGYLISPLWTHRVDPALAAQETRPS